MKITNYTYIVLIILFLFRTEVSLGKDSDSVSVVATRAVITGKTSNIPNGGVVQITLIDYGIDDARINKKIFTTIKDNQYQFIIDSLTHPLYLVFNFREASDLNYVHFILSPNDEINIDQSSDASKFSGTNSSIYDCIIEMTREGKEKFNNYGWSDRNNKPLIEEFKFTDEQLKYNLEKLKSYEEKMPQSIYSLLKTDLIYGAANYKYSLLNLKKTTAQQIGYDPGLLLMKGRPSVIGGNLYSYVFPYYVTSKYTYDYCTAINEKFDPTKCIDYVYENFHGILKEQLGTYLIIKNIKMSNMTAPQNYALSAFSNQIFKDIIVKATANRVEGREAIDFSLPDKDGRNHSLSEYRGNIVVLDFWFTGCGACKELAPKLAYVAEKLKREKVVFLSISVDKSKATWLKSVKAGEYTFKGCIELYTDGMAQSHPELSKYKILGFPTLILINQAGKIMNNPISPRDDGGADMLKLIYAELNKRGVRQ
ncbi:MAG: TlpA disulfide reductase family protein [Pedobacter sp.]|jgi:thiol-disulfide isomerase/thioredoxin|uniref:TlpA family protein disulfide reductase n=1 Tax=Pedobacter sp. TaxID=1411316 RepID=UPI0035664FAE